MMSPAWRTISLHWWGWMMTTDIPSMSPFLEALGERLLDGWRVAAASYERDKSVVMELRRGQSTRMFTTACGDEDLTTNHEQLAHVAAHGIGARHGIKHT